MDLSWVNSLKKKKMLDIFIYHLNDIIANNLIKSKTNLIAIFNIIETLQIILFFIRKLNNLPQICENGIFFSPPPNTNNHYLFSCVDCSRDKFWIQSSFLLWNQTANIWWLPTQKNLTPFNHTSILSFYFRDWIIETHGDDTSLKQVHKKILSSFKSTLSISENIHVCTPTYH